MIYLTWMRQASFSIQHTTFLHQKGQECSGGKKAKMHLSISLCTNIAGDKETPLVIWKSLNPHCFEHVNKKTLLVEYHANKKAWITSVIFENFKKFCCSWIMLRHIQMFSFAMWNWSTCQPIQPLFCNHLTKESF